VASVSDTRWVPREIDLTRPSPARVYDYLLDGACNFAADRELVEQMLVTMPWVRDAARLNRSFLRRGVLFAAERGVTQFLDLGSGIPTVGAPHEVAAKVAPEDVRVLYVDNEPVAVAHTRMVLADVPGVAVLESDLCDVDRVLGAARSLLDLDRPVAVLLAAALHFVPDELDPAGVVRRYVAALAPGSVVVISHATLDPEVPGDIAGAVEMSRRMSTAGTVRSREEVTALVDGLDVVKPGVVFTSQWRPDQATAPGFVHGSSANLAVVAVKR
jgi:hypothetical protein